MPFPKHLDPPPSFRPDDRADEMLLPRPPCTVCKASLDGVPFKAEVPGVQGFQRLGACAEILVLGGGARSASISGLHSAYHGHQFLDSFL